MHRRRGLTSGAHAGLSALRENGMRKGDRWHTAHETALFAPFGLFGLFAFFVRIRI